MHVTQENTPCRIHLSSPLPLQQFSRSPQRRRRIALQLYQGPALDRMRQRCRRRHRNPTAPCKRSAPMPAATVARRCRGGLYVPSENDRFGAGTRHVPQPLRLVVSLSGCRRHAPTARLAERSALQDDKAQPQLTQPRAALSDETSSFTRGKIFSANRCISASNGWN